MQSGSLSWRGQQRDVGHPSAGDAQQVFGSDREHRVGRSACRIDNVVPKKVAVDDGGEGLRVRERRNAADGVAGGGADELGVRLARRSAEKRADLREVDAV